VSPRFSDRLREVAAPIFAAQLEHPFVRGLADGTLPPERFRRYVRQDYVFLLAYARALSFASARAPSAALQRRLAQLAASTIDAEAALHRELAAEWGVSAAELAEEPAEPVTAGYADFLLRVAALGDFAEIAAALLPCMWGYSELGRTLAAEDGAGASPYRRWIALYADDGFAELAEWCRELVDGIAAEAGPDVCRRMEEAYLASARHELLFWEMAWTVD
jgi:thiaminase/transcriptional activator TenA